MRMTECSRSFFVCVVRISAVCACALYVRVSRVQVNRTSFFIDGMFFSVEVKKINLKLLSLGLFLDSFLVCCDFFMEKNRGLTSPLTTGGEDRHGPD